jgi:hypothetical protein
VYGIEWPRQHGGIYTARTVRDNEHNDRIDDRSSHNIGGEFDIDIDYPYAPR